MIRTFRTLASSISFAVCAIGCACAATVATEATPLVAYTVPVAPWTFPERPDQGVAPEYLAFLFHEAGIPLKLDTVPYLRAINGLRDGSSVAALLIPDAERDQFALRLCTVTTIRSGIIYKKIALPRIESATPQRTNHRRTVRDACTR